MTAPIATFNLSATVSAASGPIAVGDVVVPIGGVFYKATATNRATAAVRAQGVAMTAWSASTTGAVVVQNVGIIDAATTALGAGAASWVRVSSAGVLERAAVSGTDDVVGFCAADGTLYALFGMFTAAIVNGGGGGFTPPTGTGLVSVTGASLDAASRPIAAGFYTWIATPNSANLATLVTDETGTGELVFSTAPLFKTTINLNNPGNTFKYVLTPAAIAADRILNLPLMTGTDTVALLAFAQTFTNKAIDLGSNTVTFTSAQLATACSNETGSGALVFGTGPTLADPVVTTTKITNANTGTINDCTLSGTSGTRRRVHFTHASGATVTGFDATGIGDGTILSVTAIGGSVSFPSESLTSAAANRITTNSNFTMVLTQGSRTEFEYDLTNTRWRALDASAI